jgi:hypothetical protein
MKLIICGLLVYLIAGNASAGDAVAIGYNGDGVWTAVTYSRSLTPKGGRNYHRASQACVLARRDLWARASEDLVRTKVISQSDQTGYVTVARGRTFKTNADFTAIGRARSAKGADNQAMKKLQAADAMIDQKIVYRYFSYGEDSSAQSKKGPKLTSR